MGTLHPFHEVNSMIGILHRFDFFTATLTIHLIKKINVIKKLNIYLNYIM
jgi:hypothetical protein